MKNINRVQRYLDGEMTEVEIRLFEEDLKKDPDLAEELELHRQIVNTVISHDEVRFRNKLKEAYHLYSINKSNLKVTFRTLKKPQRWIYFLGLLSMVIFFIFLFMRNKSHMSNDELFDHYYTKYTRDIQSRSFSEESSNNLDIGIYFYYAGDYHESHKRLTKYMENEVSATASFYSALSEVELGNFGHAIDYFKDVLEMDFNYYQEPCQWYLGLSYLKLNMVDEARETFHQFTIRKSFYTEKAEEILHFL